jgi:hypothetical protein
METDRLACIVFHDQNARHASSLVKKAQSVKLFSSMRNLFARERLAKGPVEKPVEKMRKFHQTAIDYTNIPRLSRVIFVWAHKRIELTIFSFTFRLRSAKCTSHA